MATKSEITALLVLLEQAYPNLREPLKEGTIKVFSEFLSDIPFKDLEKAVASHISSEDWFPSVAQIRKAVSGFSQLPTAMEAWGEAEEMMRHNGTSWKPDFENPVLMATVKAMGWKYLCMSTNKVADRANFRDTYEELASRHQYQHTVTPEVRAVMNGNKELPSG